MLFRYPTFYEAKFSLDIMIMISTLDYGLVFAEITTPLTVFVPTHLIRVSYDHTFEVTRAFTLVMLYLICMAIIVETSPNIRNTTKWLLTLNIFIAG